MLETFLKILLIFLPLVIAYIILERRNTKIKKIKSSNVVLVKDATVTYPSLPLNNYGIPLMTRRQSRVQVVFPRLTQDGDVEYIYSWHNLNDVQVMEHTNNNDTKLIIIKQLAHIIQEQLQIEPELSAIEQRYRQINELADLVSTSDIYAGQVDTYEKALVQTKDLLKKATQLHKLYVHLIREALIGVQVAEYNPDSIQVSQLTFDLQYQRIKEEYQNMKDVADAYSELLNESKTIRSEQ